METEERTRSSVLLENIQTQVNLIAEICGSLVKRQDDTIEWLRKLDDGQRKLDDGQRKLDDGQRSLDDGQRKLEDGQRKLEDGQRKLEVGLRRLEDRHDVLLGRVDRMEIRFELKLNELEALAGDAQLRLKRIETHLQLSSPGRSAHASPQRKLASDEPASKRGKKS
jgi:peptidoglycan hydrolase CwlO-like protein